MNVDESLVGIAFRNGELLGLARAKNIVRQRRDDAQVPAVREALDALVKELVNLANEVPSGDDSL